jgi:hypothetical protein
MQRLPTITGIIRRRLLINFSADANIVQKILPAGMSPKLHEDRAIVGICLIRLEHIRPKGMPEIFGFSSENAAHRIAVRWKNSEGQDEEGVFIPRRDTNSLIATLAGGRLFPGEHHHSEFQISDDGDSIVFTMKAKDGMGSIKVQAKSASQLPLLSSFSSLEVASKFFELGAVGFSVTKNPRRYDGIKLAVQGWKVGALDVSEVESSFFMNETQFPKGSIQFDHGLIMRDIAHEWHTVADYCCN